MCFHLPRRRFVAALLALLALIASPTATAAADEPAPDEGPPALGGTFLVGDSTSSRLFGQWEAERGGKPTYNWWRHRHPDWYVDAVGGRSVVKLPERITDYLTTVDSAPSLFVMALGTNPRAGWTKASFENALALLPRTTKVVIVVPVRAGTNKGEKATQVTRYAGWLRQIAASERRYVVASWRKRVLTDPEMDPRTGASPLTVEGVHQTNPRGRRAWLEVVDAAVARALTL